MKKYTKVEQSTGRKGTKIVTGSTSATKIPVSKHGEKR
jgi:hypothetical protein